MKIDSLNLFFDLPIGVYFIKFSFPTFCIAQKVGHDASIVMRSLPPHKNPSLHFIFISYRQYFSLFFLLDQKERKNQENAPTVRISSRTSLLDARREILNGSHRIFICLPHGEASVNVTTPSNL